MDNDLFGVEGLVNEVFDMGGFLFVGGVGNVEGLIGGMMGGVFDKLDDGFEKFLVWGNFLEREKVGVVDVKEGFNIEQAGEKRGGFGYGGGPGEIC